MSNQSKLKSIFKDLINKQIVLTSDVEIFEYDSVKFQRAYADVEARLKVKLSSGFCSSILKNQITRHYCGLGEVFQDRIEFYSGSVLCDAIEQIENGVLKGEKFEKSKNLIGLHKAHHSALSQSSFILKNVLNGINGVTPNSVNYSSLSAQLNDVHSRIISKRKRENRLTGEWIVYATMDSVNYYLCLATHHEGKGDGDLIYGRIKPCFDEFPILDSYKMDSKG